MLGSLIFGAAAGLLVPIVEPVLKKLISKRVLDEIKLEEKRLNMMALILLMISAALLSWILGVQSSAFLLAFGAGIGLFWRQIYRFVRSKLSQEDDEMDEFAAQEDADYN